STTANVYVTDAGQFVRTDFSGNPTMGLITYRDAKLGTLNIFGGSGGNSIRVNDAPLTYGFNFGLPGVSINTGVGSDTVYVRGTTGSLGVDLGAGFFQNIYIGDAATSLDAIRGDIRVTGGNSVSAIVTDQATTTGRVLQFDANRLGVQTITRSG